MVDPTGHVAQDPDEKKKPVTVNLIEAKLPPGVTVTIGEFHIVEPKNQTEQSWTAWLYEAFQNGARGLTMAHYEQSREGLETAKVLLGVSQAAGQVCMEIGPECFAGGAFRGFGESGLTALADSDVLMDEIMTQSLSFGPNDLVYGPSANGALRELQSSSGGVMLNDLMKPTELTVEQFSIQTMNNASMTGRMIRFDLTHVQDLPGTLNGTGTWGQSVTAAELRYLRSNWDRFSGNTRFYQNGVEVSPPW
jgi:hypothetical protein